MRKGRVQGKLNKPKWQEILWPDTCPFCGKVNAAGICADCRKKARLLTVKEPRCMKCGKPVRYEEMEYCQDCTKIRHIYDRGVSLWLHREPVNTSIYRFKYHNQRFYAGFYADELVKKYGGLIKRWSPEMIVPVPLHSRRRRKRGYNQAELLAWELGKLLMIPVASDFVFRVRDTSPQKMLDNRKRRKNLEKAFAVRIPRHMPECVLVIDDIYTTGNTVDAVAGVLKKAGVQKVYFLTISIGQGY